MAGVGGAGGETVFIKTDFGNSAEIEAAVALSSKPLPTVPENT
jgi:hypothetical protein